MRLLGFSGSLRRASTNTAVLEGLPRLAPGGVEIVICRYIGALPHFNPDDDGETPPPSVISLRKLAGASGGLIIAAPEFAHGVPGALKNVLDWLVASLEPSDKPVAPVNAAPRARHAQAALREILITVTARLSAEAFILPPLTGQDAGADRIVANPALAQARRAGLGRFTEAIRGDAAWPGALYNAKQAIYGRPARQRKPNAAPRHQNAQQPQVGGQSRTVERAIQARDRLLRARDVASPRT